MNRITRVTACMAMFLAVLASDPALAKTAAEARQAVIEGYVSAIKGSHWPAQKLVCNEVQWMGLSDPALFDVIEAQLVAQYPSASGYVPVDRASWYAKALAASGNAKYRPTLERIAEDEAAHKKIKRHASAALQMLDNYSRWNPVIAATDGYRQDKPLKVNNFANMLRSDIPELHVIAAKRISYEKISDDYLLDIVHTKLKTYPAVDDDKARVDALSWLIRIAASSGQPRYVEPVRTIAANYDHQHIREFARRALRKYDR